MSVTLSGTGVLTQEIVTAGLGSATTVIIEGYTSIGDDAFNSKTQITSITIGNSVTSIGSTAFYSCTGLTLITIPNSVTSIGDSAFEICTGLTSVTIGNSVTSIGSYTFYSCSGLTSVIIPVSVTSIGDSAFGSSGLTTVTIANGQVISGTTFVSPATSVEFFGATVTTVSTVIPPTIIFNAITAIYGDAPTAIEYTSNSDGAVTFTSSNELIATVSGSTITFVSPGSSTITLNQAATDDYESASVPATCTVSENTASNPLQITTGTGLEYFLSDTTAQYGVITTDITVTETLVASSDKVMTSSDYVRIFFQ